MKKTIILLLLAFVILQPVASSAALSLEALEMVEQLRRDLQANQPAASDVAQVAEPDKNEYVVGKELKEALSRLRRNVYGDAARSENTSETLTLQDRTEKINRTIEEENVPELYIAGSELKEAIARVRATRDPAEINNNIDQFQDNSSAPVAASISTSKDTSLPEPESLQLKFHRNEATKDVEKAAEISAADNASEISETAQEEMQNRALNRQISKREFKMPKNYRIIVR